MFSFQQKNSFLHLSYVTHWKNKTSAYFSCKIDSESLIQYAYTHIHLRCHVLDRMWCTSERDTSGKKDKLVGTATVAYEENVGCCIQRRVMKKNDYAEEDEVVFTESANEKRKAMLKKMKQSEKANDESFRDTFNFRSSNTRRKLKQSVIDKTKAAAVAQGGRHT